MDDVLQKLLSSELLSEEAKAEISSQWHAAVEQYKAAVREEVTMTVRSELAEQWATERETLIEGIEKFVDAKLAEEVAELKADVERFRDLEAEYAQKLVEEKHAMADKLSEELEQLIDKIDAFFELRLTEEMNELKEDIEIVKQNDFGRRIFEAFVNEFNRSYVDEDSLQAKLAAMNKKLADAEKTISELEEAQAKMVREAKLKEILAPLSGKKREQMEFVLANVETSRLEEAYRHFIGRVLKEEGTQDSKPQPATRSLLKETAVVVTGEENASAEAAKQTDAKGSAAAQLRKLAGI
jgi:hypothetical protein